MDFRQGSKMSLLIQLQQAHALVPATLAGWIFSPPVALSNDPSGFDTKIKVTATEANATYGGSRTFKYDRIDLDALRRTTPTKPVIALTGATRVYDCFQYLLKTLGVLFDQDDLQDGDVVANEDGTFTIPLVAKPTCILWTGSWQYLAGGLPHISLAITQPYFDWA